MAYFFGFDGAVDAEALSAYGVAFESFEGDPSFAEGVVGVVGEVFNASLFVGPGRIGLFEADTPEAGGGFLAGGAQAYGVGADEEVAEVDGHEESLAVDGGGEGALDDFEALAQVDFVGVFEPIDGGQ